MVRSTGRTVSFWGPSRHRRRGRCGGVCLTWNGLKEEELEKSLKSYCLQPESMRGPAAFPGKQVEVCTAAHLYTCTAAHHTCTHQMHPLLCPPSAPPSPAPRPAASAGVSPGGEIPPGCFPFRLFKPWGRGKTVTLIHDFFFLIKKGKPTNILKPSALPLTPP